MTTFVGNVTPPEGLIVDGVNLYKRVGADSPWIFVESIDPDEPFELDFIEHQAVDVAAAFVVAGIEQVEGEWVFASIQTSSERDLPNFDTPFSGLAAAQVGSDVVLTWTVSSDLIDHYELGFGASEEARVIVGTFPGKLSEIRVPWWATGATTYYLIAVAETGQRSTTLSAAVTIVAEHNMPSQGSVDEHTAGYTGTKTDTEVSGGNLQIEVNPALTTSSTTATNASDHPTWGVHKGSGTYTTAAVDAGSVVDEKVEVSVTAGLSKTTPTTKDVPVQVYPTWLDGAAVTPGTRGVLQHVGTDLALLTGIGVAVEIDTAQDGVPTWDGFRKWSPGKRYTFRQVRLRLTLSCPWLYANVQLSGFTWRRRRRNRKDEGSVTVVGTGGTSVTFAEPFTAAPVVTATLYETSLGNHVRVASVTKTGCDVRVFDTSGTELSAGTVVWQATGV